MDLKEVVKRQSAEIKQLRHQVRMLKNLMSILAKSADELEDKLAKFSEKVDNGN